ncbi:MAG TPA: hypothetical protein VFB89_04160 [Gemmatimonadales bacterium]|jgi:hypothetical protein|nr:hypothetical protein [Gemmatimonadales bacterium]
MRILDTDNQGPVRRIHVYLTPGEAEKLTRALNRLLLDPEASEAQRVLADDSTRDLSVSIVTPAKLQDTKRYTDAERRMFAEP